MRICERKDQTLYRESVRLLLHCTKERWWYMPKCIVGMSDAKDSYYIVLKNDSI